jgi:spore coat protein U-like protein
MSMKIIAPIAAGVLLAMAGTAQAVTKTSQFTVSASVSKNCVINTVDLNLGTFDGTNDLSASSNVTVRCTNGTPYSVSLSKGASPTFTSRRLTLGADTLVYNLYTDAGTSIIWGDGTDSSVVVADSGSGMGTAKTHTMYGELLASANTGAVGAGAYTDLITATISY